MEIVKPLSNHVEDPRKYYNRKGLFEILVQVAVSADYKVLFVSAKHGRNTHDTTESEWEKIYDMLSKSLLLSWAHVLVDDSYRYNG